jgi:hypothetical protein
MNAPTTAPEMANALIGVDKFLARLIEEHGNTRSANGYTIGHFATAHRELIAEVLTKALGAIS